MASGQAQQGLAGNGRISGAITGRWSRWWRTPTRATIPGSGGAGLFGLRWHSAYSASKFDLRGLSEVLRFDLRRHGIGVRLVSPGAVDTGLVRTIQVTCIDMAHPAAQRLKQRFLKHAVTPEKAAAAIMKGIRCNRYPVFTSPDIAVGHWSQRKFACPYELAMRLLNDQLYRVAARKLS